jgi:hypothetical protein
VVVIAGDDHDLPIRTERLTQRSEYRLGRLQRFARRAVAKLQQITQHDQPVDSLQRADQRVQRARTAQDIDVAARAEVQIGDDQGAHAIGGARA